MSWNFNPTKLLNLSHHNLIPISNPCQFGDGTKIQIWRDWWLPTPTTYKIQSVPIPQMEDSRVAMLINRDTKMWDISLLHVLFRPEEVKVITNMPISPFLPPDRLIWQGTKNGSFSVRSAYHLGME
jgi:hypothetical protein